MFRLWKRCLLKQPIVWGSFAAMAFLAACDTREQPIGGDGQTQTTAIADCPDNLARTASVRSGGAMRFADVVMPSHFTRLDRAGAPLESLSEDLEVVPLWADEWTLADYTDLESPRQEGQERLATGVRYGRTTEVFQIAPPALELHSEAPRSVCLLSKPVPVLPEQRYTFFGHVRVRDLEPADATIVGTYFVKELEKTGEATFHALDNHQGTSAGWQREVLAFRTTPEAMKLQVGACVGGNGRASGSAWFDNVALVRHRAGSGPLPEDTINFLVANQLAFPWRHSSREALRSGFAADPGWPHPSVERGIVRKLELGGDVRTALVFPPPSKLVLPVDLPERARIRGAYSFANPGMTAPDGWIELRLRAQTPDGTLQPLLRRRVSSTDPEEVNDWMPFEVEIPSAGKVSCIHVDVRASEDLEGAAFALGDAAILSPKTSGPRRIVLISLDTLRADALGVYGSRRPTSPAIDALGRRGVVFERAYAPAPWTLPSHVTMFTGLDPMRHGVLIGEEHKMSSDQLTLAERLQAQGFRTVGIHGGGFVGADFGFAQGFDRYHLVGRVDEAVDAAMEVLTSEDSRDLFLFFHTYHVHAPYREAEEELESFGDRYFELRKMLSSEITPQQLGSYQYLSRHQREGLPADQLEMVRLLYDGLVREVDSAVGRLLAGLEDTGGLENTTILLTSDHGESFQEHGTLMHASSLYEEELRIPLIAAGADVPAGRKIDTVVTLSDIAPTVLDLAGVEIPEGMDGSSLVKLWNGRNGRAKPQSRSAGASLVGTETASFARVEGETKYMLERGVEMLFDLENDPSEQRDLSASRPDEVEFHRSRVLQDIANLPGLHVVFSAPAPGDRLEGFLELARPPKGVRIVLGKAAEVRFEEEGRLRIEIRLDEKLAWINLDGLQADDLQGGELRYRGEPLPIPSPDRYRTGSLQEVGLQVFAKEGSAETLQDLSGSRLDQLRALGYVE